MLPNFTKWLDLWVALGVPGIDCIIYQDGKCIYRYKNGYSDLEQKLPMTGQERYNIYSCSKFITCSAALQLWEQGKFQLDDPLAKYMPAFSRMTVRTEAGIVPAKNPITIRHLFTMSAGLNYDVTTPELQLCRQETQGRCETVKVMEYLARQPLDFEPGTRFQYSLCHDVLAALVEVVSGQSFGSYVKENIFDPMGMTRTTFLLPEEQQPEVAAQYSFDRPHQQVRAIHRDIAPYKIGSCYESGGAGCISTVEDYVKFLEGVRTGALLKPETLAEMTTLYPIPNPKDFGPASWGYGYGLGIRCPLPDSGKTDIGWDGAAGSYAAIDPVNGLSIFIGMHMLTSPIEGIRLEAAARVRQELLGK